jgi:hypothetical protein
MATAMLALGLGPMFLAAAEARTKPPNILFIIMDDPLEAGIVTIPPSRSASSEAARTCARRSAAATGRARG